jgi:methylamine utilization protein MauE
VIDPAVVLLLSVCSAALFGSAALHKLAALQEFESALRGYEILPGRIVGAVSYILPLCELLIATSLCIEALRARATAAAALMLVAYALAIAVNLRRKRRYIDCGCAGFGERRAIAAWMVVRNLAFALLLMAFDVLPWSARALHWTDVVTVAGGALIIAFLYLTAEELLGRLPHVMRTAGAAR